MDTSNMHMNLCPQSLWLVQTETHRKKNILSCVLVTKTGFGLVIGFIDYLQLVTTNSYYTVPDLHNLQSSRSISTYLHYPFPGNGSHSTQESASHSQYHCTKSLVITINRVLPLYSTLYGSMLHAHTHTLVLSWQCN
jgi:hypothetical protein